MFSNSMLDTKHIFRCTQHAYRGLILSDSSSSANILSAPTLLHLTLKSTTNPSKMDKDSLKSGQGLENIL